MQAFENPSGSEETKQEGQSNVLAQFVTQVAQSDLPQQQEDGEDTGEVDLHRQHFEHTLTAL